MQDSNLLIGLLSLVVQRSICAMSVNDRRSHHHNHHHCVVQALAVAQLLQLMQTH
jgi:hypothetical protein